jgi:predicted transcriptional regulator with HTH domain
MKKYYKMKYIYCFFLFLLQVNLVIGQEPCNFHVDAERAQYVRSIMTTQVDKSYNGQMPMVRLALHNVRKNDGTGGYNWTDYRRSHFKW